MNPINILIVIPAYKRESQVINCIRSLMDYTNVVDGIDIQVAVAINEMNTLLRTELDEYKKNSKFPLYLHDMGSNVGKGIAVNNVASKYQFDYIVSMDSDMICIDSNWLLNMLKAYMRYNKSPYKNSKRNYEPRYMGCLCTNQRGASAHNVKKNDSRTISIKPSPELTIVSPINGAGVAGGVLMSDSDTWKMIGGYNGGRLFAADDGQFTDDCHRNNRLVGYLDEVYFYHPYELNDDYRKWKNNELSSAFIFKSHATELTLITDITSEIGEVVEPIGHIHILWATTRPHVFKQTHKIWMENASSKLKISTKVAVDSENDAKELIGYDVMVTNNKKPGVCYPSYCLSSTLKGNKEDIVIFASDDFYPPKNWDSFIAMHMNSDNDKVLVVNDGIQAYPNKVVTIPIMHYGALRRMNGIIYHPVYDHMHSDNELYTTAEKMGLMKDIRNTTSTVFKHMHYSANLRKKDSTDSKVDASLKTGATLYASRQKLPIRDLLKVDSSIDRAVAEVMNMNKIELSILVCTTDSRKHFLDRLIGAIKPQLTSNVELLIESDDGTMKIGRKRNILLDRAKGNYICFFDDDDMPSNDYVRKILNAIKSSPDCCSLEGIFTEDGNNPTPFRHSLKYSKWETIKENGRLVHLRMPNHLNAVRRDIALKVRFNDKLSKGEDRDYSKRLRPYLSHESIIDGVIYHYLYQNAKKGY